MPRSSRHKSSKHSSKEAKEYSDSEKESGLKDRKGKEESGGVRVSKDSSSSEKRKVDSKDGKDLYGGSGNGDYSEDYSSSKRRKERTDDRASDRWNGGEDDHRGGGEGSKKSSKASGDSKSRRRDESMGMYEEAEEVKKSSSSGKGEGRHRDRERDSGRKEGRDGGVERDRDKEKDRERKSKEGRSERLVGGDEHRSAGKQVVENSDLNAQCESGSPGPDSQLERRMKKRRDSSIDVDKHQDDDGDINDRRLSSRDDAGKDGRQKDERRKEDRYKEDRYKEKYREDVDRDSKHRDDRQRDERSTKDHLGSRSEDKHVRDDKDNAEMQNKRSKLHDGERKGENDRDRHRDLNPIRDRDRDRLYDRERDHEHERERGRDRDYDRDHDWDWDGDRDRDRDRNRDRERERDRDRVRDRDRDRDYERDHDFDRDYGSSHPDDRASRYKDSSRVKRRSPDDRDDFIDIPSRGSKARYSDVEKKSISGDRTESDANKGRSHSRQTHIDTIASSDKRKDSPSSSPHVGLDEFRYPNPEDLKYRDSIAEQRSKAVPSKDASGFSGVLERGSRYRSVEKSSKVDDTPLGELSNEKSSSSKASPLGLIERSPSASSIDRRYMNKTGARRSLDIEEMGRKRSASIDNRDFDDRLNRDLPSEKPLLDESSPVDSSYNRNNQANSSLIPPHPAFRAGVDSPSFISSMEDEGRINSSSRYRRNGDPNMGRGHNNAWRGVPNWTSPLPNGFIPFQHGPPGAFQGIMPQFPGPIFGVRPSMEINHSGMPYHIPDADRFPGHLRPLGWQTMMDTTGPSHMHGWDGSNGVFRDEPHLFGATEWDQNRHPMNSRGRESSVDTWKGQNGDLKRDLLSPSHKDDLVQASVDDASAVQFGQMSNHEDNREHGTQGKLSQTRSGVTSSAEESTPKFIHEKKLDSSKSSKDDVSCLSRYYLSKLDISVELARPELYNQCISLLGIDKSETNDEKTTRPIMSKDYLRAGAKSSATSWISSHFSSIKDSVFQRAMDLYKKERMEGGGIPFLSKRTLDIVSKPKKENVEEQIHHDEVKVEDPVHTSDTEMVDAPNEGLDMENVEAVSSVAVEEKMEVILTPCHEVQNHNGPHSPRLEVPVKDDFQDNQGETLASSGGVKEEAIPSELVKSEDTNADGFASADDASRSMAPLLTEGDNINGCGKGNANGGHSVNHVEEGMALDDALSGPVLGPDGSPKDCEAVMSGSNESESVNLSRIHHSPESTH